MLLRGLQRLVDALADGHRRHNDDVLAPAVTLVQLVHGLDVCIGLTGAGLHLNGQVHAGAGQLVRGPQAVPPLDSAEIIQYPAVGHFRDERLVAEAHFAVFHGELLPRRIAQIAAIGHRAVGLAVEHVADRRGGLCLKGLVFELKLHQITFTFVSGERFLKISVTLILLSSLAKELSRNTARRGCRSAMRRITVSGTFSSKQATSAPSSTL